MPEIRPITTPDAIRECYPVMAQLRPHLTEDVFIEQILRQIAGQPYHLVALYDPAVVALAGYRFGENLADGRYLYVDDLVTNEGDRGRNYGGQLFDWLVAEASRQGCVHLSLDSGVQRFAAHRFYLTKRMEIRSHHFSLAIGN